MTRYFLLSGAGNDFLALVAPQSLPAPATLRRWCRRGLSVGADGVLHLDPRGDRILLSYRNADGGPAELCVNGARCAARLAFHLGWADREAILATAAGTLRARRAGAEEIEIDLPPPGEAREITLRLAERSWRGFSLRVGVPHLVVPWDGDLETAPLATVGPHLRAHPALGVAGANVDFVVFAPPHRLSLRTFERGVEGETLACGSGILAAAAVGVQSRQMRFPLTARSRGGYALVVRGEHSAGQIHRWSLRGDARLLAEGILHPGAEAPEPIGE